MVRYLPNPHERVPNDYTMKVKAKDDFLSRVFRFRLRYAVPTVVVFGFFDDFVPFLGATCFEARITWASILDPALSNALCWRHVERIHTTFPPTSLAATQEKSILRMMHRKGANPELSDSV